MGTLGRRGVLGRGSLWLRGLALVSWAALVAGACSGSKIASLGQADGGDPAGGQRDGDDSGPVVAGHAGSNQAHGGQDPGGTGGSSGRAGASVGGTGSAGRPGAVGGAGGSPPGIVGSRLGRGCVNDSDCQSANETGLTCISETSTILGNGAPPRGLCSRSCTADEDCAAHSAGALCYQLGLTKSFCVEGCEFGSPDIGEAKCHSRPELACDPALMASTGDICTSTSDCQAGELCTDGTCNVVFSACLPSCRGDLDCAAGMYCDQSFLSGLCKTSKPSGKRLGEPCTVPAANQPDEPDGCLGFCQADSNVGTQGHCATTCGLARECAWDAASQRFDGVCFYASILSAEVGAVGDFGFCTPTCNCSGQCNDPTLGCRLLAQGALEASTFKGPGLCFSPEATTTPFEECASGGSGAGAGGSGAGGAAGAGGAP